MLSIRKVPSNPRADLSGPSQLGDLVSQSSPDLAEYRHRQPGLHEDFASAWACLGLILGRIERQRELTCKYTIFGTIPVEYLHKFIPVLLREWWKIAQGVGKR